jgi:RNase H-like domain found in reverse transcriptase
MAPTEFKWSEDTQQAMDKLKYLTATTVPIRTIDYGLAREVPMSLQHTSDYGLVSIAVDSSPIGCGWIVSQQLEDTEYPIIFGSLMFNKVESHYSQPKLELFGVFWALTAERYHLHGIHFRLVLDASYIGKMINNPGLPNAAMTRWITYILLFDFKIQHRSATKHCGPDGLSRRQHADEDSSNSKYDSKADEGIKIMKMPKDKFDAEEREQDIPESALSRQPGEHNPLEVVWADPIVVDIDDCEANLTFGTFEGEATIPSDAELSEKLDHKHKVYENDSLGHWDDILVYLSNLKLPEDRK